MAIIATVSPTSIIPRRLDGVVTVEKDGTVIIEYREKGMVKPKTKLYPAEDLIMYQAGAPGFVVERSADPIVYIVGTPTKDGNIKTENGVVVINANASQLGAIINRSEVDDESKEAKAAERAGAVKVKIRPVAPQSGNASRREATRKPAAAAAPVRRKTR